MVMIGNVGRQNYGGGGNNSNTDFGAGKYILKEGLKRDWYIYRPSEHSVFRPYPKVIGNTICPSRNVGDEQLPYSILPDACAVIRLAAFAGTTKTLEFVDYCTDGSQFAEVGQEYMPTPYEYLIRALKKMLPKQGGLAGTGQDGIATPQQLNLIQKSVSYSTESLVFRGAMCIHRGQQMGTKNSRDGKLLKAIFAITQKSAITAFMTALNQPTDPRQPASATNNVLKDMFELDGAAVKIQRAGDKNYTVSADYDPNYAAVFMREFGITDPSQYPQALSQLFGPYQNMEDIFNLLTTEQMVQILKDNYPISWLWFAWKDTPYAQFVTREEQIIAMQDPEMAERFGLPKPVGVPTAAPQMSYPQADSQSAYQQQAPAQLSYGYPQATATAEDLGGGLKKPVGYPQPGAYPQAPAAQAPVSAYSPQPDITKPAPQSNNDALQDLYNRYNLGGGQSGDGIPY